MEDRNECEACGARVEYRIEGSTQGLFCTQCGWSLVTTYIPKIAWGITQYQRNRVSCDDDNEISAFPQKKPSFLTGSLVVEGS
ncbi:MAG: hypothetical protein F6K47_42920 [Symploca sp. SIO2E6]|nr:hypothetical protein [Symploca sp. SIO2E6]